MLEEILSVQQLGCPTKVIIPLRKGGVLIESYSSNQRKVIEDLLKQDTRVDYREVRNIEPVVQLSGIEKGYSDKELSVVIKTKKTF